MFVKLKTQIDKTETTIKRIKTIGGMRVLVGITEETSNRKEGDVTNAQLAKWHTKGVMEKSMREEIEETMSRGKSFTYNKAHSMYIKTHGSPLYRIPPRPMIEPALEATGNKERIVEDLKIAIRRNIEEGKEAARDALETAGEDAENMIKAWFEDPRNEWEPLADSTKKRRKKNSDLPLQDTGALRNAMTHTIDETGGKG